MIHDPDVLILDEPTTGLDPNQIVEIRELIKKIGQNKTVMLSTHIMQEVEALCSRVIIINKGKIIADQPTKTLKHNLGGVRVFEVEFDREIDTDALAAVAGITEIKSITKGVYRIQSEADKDLRAGIFAWAVEQKVAILSQKEIEQRLEDVFKKLTVN